LAVGSLFKVQRRLFDDVIDHQSSRFGLYVLALFVRQLNLFKDDSRSFDKVCKIFDCDGSLPDGHVYDWRTGWYG
jgi:hypothetical protein